MTESQPHVTARTWIGFAFMCLGMFMAILDIQIVATSLPTIRAALHIGADQMVWVQTAYLTAEIVAIPMTGYLTRLLGMRRLFVVAITMFTLASAGCAISHNFATLIAFRVLQGFAGGTLIPAVFSAVFLLFPQRSQGLATTIAGLAAVFAPTIGPIVGGWLTQTYSWHWLFLVNIVPGIVAATGAAAMLPRSPIDRHALRTIDSVAVLLLAVALTALEIGLKDAPRFGWGSLRVAMPLALFVVGGVVFVWRTLRSQHPIVELRNFADRNFTIGCAFSFALGVGLFGSTYLMPFFLGLVRGHGALEIGEIMLVTGIAQLVAAPIAVALEQRVDARVLTGLGFGVFAVGMGMSVTQTNDTDFAQMLVPQILRGAAIMFCLLPPTRLALGNIQVRMVADASGLFNLMRNLGGAIGLALIDTVIFSRSAGHARDIASSLRHGDVATAVSIGIPRDAFLDQVGQPIGPEVEEMVRPLIAKAALVHAINDAWLMLAVLTAVSLLLIALVRRGKQADQHASQRP
ncbi:DHA2 family efflux MFS transporter permease subunit [Sphingomonas sp. GC_Shp_3]|uniref:DHA2 family efflux MFS transporter permease subunit n=1 Tax=Sphingomonas sp. GC_Shp_3 TaxID=2937383 RepID=UPI00226A92DF|nr:DHA2 family efflux MFS transporter permease subunit [Sphingomonas sp. GC_Shp_3]